MWIEEDNLRSSLSLQSLFSISYDWGVHLEELAATEWSRQEVYLHIKKLKVKAVLLALSVFQEWSIDHLLFLMINCSLLVTYLEKECVCVGGGGGGGFFVTTSTKAIDSYMGIAPCIRDLG